LFFHSCAFLFCALGKWDEKSRRFTSGKQAAFARRFCSDQITDPRIGRKNPVLDQATAHLLAGWQNRRSGSFLMVGHN